MIFCRIDYKCVLASPCYGGCGYWWLAQQAAYERKRAAMNLEPDEPKGIPEVNFPSEKVNHPAHYGGADNPYEAIKVIEAWSLGFCLGNSVKYIARAGKKPDADRLDDLRKAAWYLNREIQKLENDSA